MSLADAVDLDVSGYWTAQPDENSPSTFTGIWWGQAEKILVASINKMMMFKNETDISDPIASSGNQAQIFSKELMEKPGTTAFTSKLIAFGLATMRFLKEKGHSIVIKQTDSCCGKEGSWWP